MMKRLIVLLSLLGLFVSTVAAQSTIFIVRHAEKAHSGGDDPDLTEAGRARAQALARILKDAGITTIYATNFKRTQQTAAPLAKVLRLDVTILPANDSATLMAKLRDSPGNVLVVGHTNTIPEIIKGFGITTSTSIGDNDYDNIFLIEPGDKPRLLHFHYP